MFWNNKYKIKKEKKQNIEKLKKLDGREVRYASIRDDINYVETVIGKNGVISIKDDIFSVICKSKIIFSSPIEDVHGSDLMSLDGIILTYKDKSTLKDVEVMVYYKYYRKVVD